MASHPENLRLFPEPEMPIDPRSGLKRNEKGEIIDDDGNIYDESGEHVVKEAPSQEFLKELAEMRRRYPALTEKELISFARGNISKRSRDAEKKAKKRNVD